VEGQDALNALDMDYQGREERRPITRRCDDLRRAWRGASRRPSSCRPLRRTMRSSQWRSWTRPTTLAPRLMPLALMGGFVTRPHVSPSFASSAHLTHLSLSVQGLRPNLWVERRGGTRRQQRTRFRRGGRRQHGPSDARGHRACVRSLLGRRWGESGLREGGEGGGGGGGGWLSGLSAAASKVPPDVESGSADRGVLGGSKGKPTKRNTARRRGGGGGALRRTRRRAETWTGTRRRMGRAAWTRRTRRSETLVRRLRHDIRPLSQGNSGSRRRRVETKRKNGRGKGEAREGARRSSPARVQRPRSDIETQSGEFYC
jgi:hypothetical protein